jgi:hypothetical protein
MKKTKPASQKLSLTPPKIAGQMRRTQIAVDESIIVTLSQQLIRHLEKAGGKP